MFTLAFAHGKYTVAAAYNLSVQVLPTIKMYGKFSTEKPYLTSLYSWIEVKGMYVGYIQ